jgi:hypothetical protein
MRWILSQRQPTGSRILLIESGSRSIAEGMIAHLKSGWGAGMPIDLITCYAGVPGGLDDDALVFRVSDYSTSDLRRTLVSELRARDYAYAGMICAAEPIMNKWKWWLGLNVPAKFFVINENGDYFWMNRKNASAMRGFVLVRMGLAGAGAARTFGRLLVFPFAVFYLLLYAGAVHFRRFLRITFARSS